MNKISLIGDVGGTNLRLQLVELPSCRKVSELTVYPSQDYPSVDYCVKHFIESNQVKPDVAVIGICGPVEKETAFCCMIPKWPVVDARQIKQQNNLQEVVLINDFIAAGFGILSLLPEDLK